MKRLGFIFAVAALIGLASCEKEEELMYVNGEYSAEAAAFSHGWKYFMDISISGDKLTVVDFDSYSEEDNTKLKSETTQEEYPMNPHPSVWIPELEAQYLAVDITSYTAVDGITGATSATSAAQGLFELLLEAAKEGDKSLQILE